MKKFIFVALISLTACTQYPMQKPLMVDGTRNATFYTDEAECRLMAASFNPGQRKIDATFGAIDGAVTDWVVGEKEDVIGGAIAGGIVGSVRGQYNDEMARRHVLVNCMQVRGHGVVG